MMMDFAKSELERAGMLSAESDYDGELGRAVLRMMEVFSEEGHSGASASIAVSIFEKLARFQPLTPLTGEDDEWTEVGDGVWQNKRCSHVFKERDGVAYDIEGRIFREPSGACFTSRDSRVAIEFPYTPHREVVDVPAEEDRPT